MIWQVQLARTAEKEFAKLTPPIRARVEAALFALTGDPKPVGAKPLSGDRTGDWQLGIGNWRILYVVDQDSRIVKVLRVAHRRDVYR